MKITKITACNFRAFSRVDVELRPELSLIIGKNNSGKTSLLVLFERFYHDKNSFTYDDFPIEVRKILSNFDINTSTEHLCIRMMLEICYDDKDNLKYLSEFITDLDPAVSVVKILFECGLDKERLTRDLPPIGEKRERFLRKNIAKYLSREVYAYRSDEDILEKNRHRLLKKDLKAVRNIINFQFIHARRDVASSEGGKNVLSRLTTDYFNANNSQENDFDPINELLLSMDKSLEESYKKFFAPFLGAAKQFLGTDDLKVISNLESKEILEDASQVVYGGEPGYLPETFNGLGHMNILYVLLAIEIKKEAFAKNGRQINLLFIEEPEAHTHPQMQYVFARQIKTLLQGIANLQAVITTHSSHIVSQCDFKDIRYLQNNLGKISAKNFHKELCSLYGSEQQSFQFVEQFLSLDTCELFFANKVIFIEGTTESMLLPYFMAAYDKQHFGDKDYIPLSSQNITTIEAGANAKAFRHLMEFLGIKALVITDLDTTKPVMDKDGKTHYEACRVSEGANTSNETIKYYLGAPELGHANFGQWMIDLKTESLKCVSASVKVAYQLAEAGQHGRSFEDSFVHKNRVLLELHKESLRGLKNRDQFSVIVDPYDLVEKVLSKKSDFASSLLFLALTDPDITWQMPKYIERGLEWIAS